MSKVDKKALELGVPLKRPPVPPGRYVTAMVIDGYCRSAGHLPLREGSLSHVGPVAGSVSMEEAADSVRVATGNCVASIHAVIGSLSQVEQVLALFGYVNAVSGFVEHHLVTNAASEFLLELFGDTVGRHVRTSVGVAGLPLNAPLEIAVECRIRL
ncbi:MAG: RidA family protein [Acidimicrobiia bacterium]|nr:RidA family protein [Acidimicrobiia bacterium]